MAGTEDGGDGVLPRLETWVTVTRTDGGTVDGVLYTIDPESHTVYLLSSLSPHPPRSDSDTSPPSTSTVEGAVSGDACAPIATLTPTPKNHSNATGHASQRSAGTTASEPDAGAHGADLRRGVVSHETSRPGSTGLRVCVILGHAVASIRSLAGGSATEAAVLVAAATSRLRDGGAADPATDPAHPTSTTSGLTVAEQKAWVVNRLKKHRVPYVEEAGDLLLMGGVATVTVPYTAVAVTSDNTMVLRRIRTLLAAPPATPLVTPKTLTTAPYPSLPD
jgi:hypothetical protein